MEFIEFIDRTEVEIIRMIEKAGYKTAENTKLCLLGENYVGFYNRVRQVFGNNVNFLYPSDPMHISHASYFDQNCHRM
mgnify:CR=1 FL=1